MSSTDQGERIRVRMLCPVARMHPLQRKELQRLIEAQVLLCETEYADV